MKKNTRILTCRKTADLLDLSQLRSLRGFSKQREKRLSLCRFRGQNSTAVTILASEHSYSGFESWLQSFFREKMIAVAGLIDSSVLNRVRVGTERSIIVDQTHSVKACGPPCCKKNPYIQVDVFLRERE